jgi:hypothetical protein
MSTIRTWRSDAPEPRREQGTSPWRNELLQLASRLSNLSISLRDPSAYVSEKSEIVQRMRQIARQGKGSE